MYQRIFSPETKSWNKIYLSDTIYQGLNLKRIDCVFVSNTLKKGNSKGTNIYLSYNNYIKPFINEMLDKDARKIDIKNFGEAYVHI